MTTWRLVFDEGQSLGESWGVVLGQPSQHIAGQKTPSRAVIWCGQHLGRGYLVLVPGHYELSCRGSRPEEQKVRETMPFWVRFVDAVPVAHTTPV